MKTFWFRHAWLGSGSFAGLLALCSLAVHPAGSVKAHERPKDFGGELHIPPQIGPTLKRSCMDCHSNNTVWPWYSYVAPMSWLAEIDVRRGRDHMNFSEWDRYSFKQREELLADIASAVKNREMPLGRYTFIHHNAKLSDADTNLLYGWARLERRRLKATHASVGARAGGLSTQRLSGQ